MTAAQKKDTAHAHAEFEDAIALLTDDHKAVKKLFKSFEKLNEEKTSRETNKGKAELVGQICLELAVHAQIEEEIFYPAVRKAIDDSELMDEADVEHATAKELIAQLGTMKPGDDHYDAKVIVLSEYINHHVKEEEGEMFPQLRKTKLDLDALGKKLAKRKQELLEKLQ
jgi:hemerythrin superfamily protein